MSGYYKAFRPLDPRKQGVFLGKKFELDKKY
jgi:hypothetical protein